MKGLILLNTYYRPAGQTAEAERLARWLQKLGAEVTVARNEGLPYGIEGGAIRGQWQKFDFCVYLDKDKYLSAMLEKQGVRLFNNHNAIQVCDDKFCTFLALANEGIPMPKTYPALLCYRPGEPPNKPTLARAEQLLGYPLVVKTSYGSLGRGVFKANNRDELLATETQLINVPHLYQQFAGAKQGADVRVIVIGKRAVAAMLRVSETDFRSNIDLGSKAYPFDLPDSFRAVAERAATLLNLDYCGVDLLFAEDGSPLLCEVNSNAFFSGIESVTRVDIAKLYAEHIAAELHFPKA